MGSVLVVVGTVVERQGKKMTIRAVLKGKGKEGSPGGEVYVIQCTLYSCI